ncbi:hypothetical protein EKD04_022255 [Chloroflexales bacterium ZM16-3]|nr:hypothetical protein [Chloroflexales bacterium ZM16-3]
MNNEDSAFLPLSDLTANAWISAGAACGPVVKSYASWVRRTRKRYGDLSATAAPCDEENVHDWRDPRVGWGVVLPWRDDCTPEQLRVGADAPEPLRELIRERQGVVLRYKDASTERFNKLWKHTGKSWLLDSTTRPELGGVPKYLLIYGSPAQIPWRLQYLLQARPDTYVGRLDLEEEGLGHYIDALRSDWKDAGVRVERSLIWAVNHGGSDITTLMHEVLAEPLRATYCADKDLRPGLAFLDGANATCSRLIAALRKYRPGVIVTTSHGQTGPLEHIEQMRATLGLPVDCMYVPLDPAALMASWEPDGAVWYAHACCSVGSDRRSMFSGLFGPGSEMAALLDGIAKVGAITASLPKALLGAHRPLRAFIGHVEPTFDWTLRQPGSRDSRVDGIAHYMLYERLFYSPKYLTERRHPKTIGRAMQAWLRELGVLNTAHDLARLEEVLTPEASERQNLKCLYYQLAARDVESTVLLGDPTVSLPPLTSVCVHDSKVGQP